MFLFFYLAFRLDPPILDVTRDDPFMDTFTLLDGDRVTITGGGKNVFVAIQPHNIMGHIFSTTVSKDSDSRTIEHKIGERFYVSDQDVILNYSYRGGAVLNVWSLPDDLCDPRYSVFSSQQREARIKVDAYFENDTKICWMLNFRTPVEMSASFEAENSSSELIVGDTKHMRTKCWYFVRPGRPILNGGLNRSSLVMLDAKKGRVKVDVELKSDIPYADWTDSPSFFVERGDHNQPDLPTYLETVRDVQLWIWILLCSIIASIFGFTLVIFFVRPIAKIHKSLSHSDDLSKKGRKEKED